MKFNVYLFVLAIASVCILVVTIPFYIATAATWERVFHVGGILGFLTFLFVGYIVPLSLLALTRYIVIQILSRLPHNVVSFILVGSAILVLSYVSRVIFSGHSKALRLIAMGTSSGIMVGGAFGVLKAKERNSASQ